MVDERKIIVNEQPRSPVAEAFRILRTNIQFSKANGELKTIVFTSIGPTEGKSTVLANTAVSMAQTDKKVLVLDCDLRKPTQHNIFGLEKEGLTNILVEGIPALSLIQQTAISNLHVLTSGPVPPNPSELLGSRMRQILEILKEHYDLILMDAPPVLAVTDTSLLVSKADGGILVVSSGVNRPELMQEALERLTKARGNIIGIVLNRAEFQENHAYYYNYYGSENKYAIASEGAGG